MTTLAGEAYVLILPKVDTAAFTKASGTAAGQFGSGLTTAVAKEGEAAGRAAAGATSKGFAQAPPDVTKPMSESGSKAASAFGSSVMPGIKTLAASMGGLMAASGVISFFKGANDEARESERVNNLTAAAIKSTGSAAGVTSEQVSRLSTSLSLMTGIDDEVIQGGENMLLTFTGVKNGVGAGNDIFNQATQAALNMSVAMGEDMNTASIQLGKALNDPIAGVGALRRVGVQLTDQQQEQVKAFVASGDVMSAQKIILGELTTEFGSAAAAAATPAEKLQVSWGNLQESVGTALIPVLDKLSGWLTKIADWMAKNTTTVLVFAGAVTALGVAFILATSPISLIIIGVAALVAGVVYAYQHFETFRDIVNGVWDVIKTAAMIAWNYYLKFVFDAIKIYIFDIVIPAFKLLWSIIQVVWDGIKAAISVAWNDVIKPVWDFIQAYIHDVIIPAFHLLQDVVQVVWDVIKSVIDFAWNHVIAPIWDLIKLGIEGLKIEFNFLQGVIETVWNGIKDAIQTAWNFIHDKIFSPLINFVKEDIPNAFHAAVDAIKAVWDKIEEYTKAPINFVIDRVYNHGIVPLWNAIGTKVGLPELKTMEMLADGGVIPGYAPGKDSVPAMLSPGEGVLVPEAVRDLGADRVLSWNRQARSGGIQYFAEGGVVGGNMGFGPSPSKALGVLESAGSGIESLLGKGEQFVLGSLIRLAQPAIDLVKSLIGQIPTNGTQVGDLIKQVPTELLDKALEWIKARDVAPAFGNIIGGSLGTGGRSVERLIQMAQQSGIPYTVNSTDRPGAADYHGQGKAVDFGGSMTPLAKFFLQYFRSLLELIHGDSGSFVKNGQIVGADYYGAATVAQHASWGGNEHVHVAMNGDAVLGVPGGGGTASGALGDWIAAAQQYVGIEWVDGLVTLIMRESGGNPNAINNWDSNAAMGDPSRGLMQTIGSTFEHYRNTNLPDNIYDPVANIVAGMNYIHSKYGSLYNVQQANANLPPMGYDNGGDLQPGMTLVRNNTGRTETVFNNSQSDSILGALSSGRGDVHVTVLLDGEPVVRRAKAVLDAHNQATINTMRSGRRL